jgi:hypothetical protein
MRVLTATSPVTAYGTLRKAATIRFERTTMSSRIARPTVNFDSSGKMRTKIASRHMGAILQMREG